MTDRDVKPEDFETVSEERVHCVDAVSLVARCPYCGARWGKAGKTAAGEPCVHPTKMTNGMRGFVAVEIVV